MNEAAGSQIHSRGRILQATLLALMDTAVGHSITATDSDRM